MLENVEPLCSISREAREGEWDEKRRGEEKRRLVKRYERGSERKKKQTNKVKVIKAIYKEK